VTPKERPAFLRKNRICPAGDGQRLSSRICGVLPVSSKRRTQGAKVSGWFFSNKNCFLQAAAATILALVMTGHAHAQAVPDTLANQPNPSDFVKRTDKNFTLGGNRIRLGGMNVGWLALRSDTGHTADLRYPTPFEVDDMLATVQAMGGRVIRIVSAGATAGCALCLVPAPGKINEEALKQLDMILKKSSRCPIALRVCEMARREAGRIFCRSACPGRFHARCHGTLATCEQPDRHCLSGRPDHTGVGKLRCLRRRRGGHAVGRLDRNPWHGDQGPGYTPSL
jgi:hypothetical protein